MANASSTLRSNDDYYGLLGVSSLATLTVIREAYKKLALRYHPDKNRTATATSDFQRLVVAWETLSDDSRRAEYDRNYVRTKRKYNDAEEEHEQATRARRRREDVDREQTSRWRRETPAHPSPSANPSAAFEAGAEQEGYFESAQYNQSVREWKAVVAETYASRLQTWTQYQRTHTAQIRVYQRILQKHTLDLSVQTSETESSALQKFRDAISRRSPPQPEDPAIVLAKLMAARKQYIDNLHQTVSSFETKVALLQRELEAARQKYEDDEADERQDRIEDALAFLGPRDLNPPLLSALDWRGRAINSWNALAGVKRGVCFSFDCEAPELRFEAEESRFRRGAHACECPWHQAGEWERAVGEYACGRCGQAAFHVIPECGSAKCPGCGMVVCNRCHRDLQLLREYEAWLMDEPSPARTPGPSPLATPMEEARGSMFELEFEARGERAAWSGNKGKGTWDWHFGNMGMNSSL